MASTINLSLTDELRTFIDSHCGDKGLYATPSEFLRDLLREKKNVLKQPIFEMGYRDILSGHSLEFSGSIHSALKKTKEKEKSGW